METTGNPSPGQITNEEGRREELVGPYMELTGADKSLARNVCACLPLYRNLIKAASLTGTNRLQVRRSRAAPDAGLAAEALFVLQIVRWLPAR